ncbi:Putative S- transferase [Salmonella enterica subsp. enterica]|uniref:S- transferase n=1 Tax=Salmonella enterica I TaxID=59201 RepID=A0A447TZ42_SALET|nr:Putative S- transferase [Salmonella enterica subsp. enterica]
MSVVTESKTARKWAMPDTLVIIFFVAILTSIATWVVPVGMFDSQEVQYQVDGQTKNPQSRRPALFSHCDQRGRGSAVSSRTIFSLPAMKDQG